jgi:hypothetical protein
MLEQVQHTNAHADSVSSQHIMAATSTLKTRRIKPHPKIADVCEAVRPVIDAGEKILIFCHHRATGRELLGTLERSLRTLKLSAAGPPQKVWRTAWESLLLDANPCDENVLTTPIIDWLCSPGLRRQIASWRGEPALNSRLARQVDRR